MVDARDGDVLRRLGHQALIEHHRHFAGLGNQELELDAGGDQPRLRRLIEQHLDLIRRRRVADVVDVELGVVHDAALAGIDDEHHAGR